MPPIIGAIIASDKASIVELQTVLGVQDAYDILEVINVDAYNEQKARDQAARSQR